MFPFVPVDDVFPVSVKEPGTHFCQIFVASGLSPGLPSAVARVSVLPATESVVVARTTVVPVVVVFVSVTVQLPVVPAVVQEPALSVPGPLTFVKLMTVPPGAFT